MNRYIIKSLKDLEEIFLPDRDYINNTWDLPIYSPPELPKTLKLVHRAMRFYEIEGFDDDYEKFPISYDDYRPNNNWHKYLGFNYNSFETSVNLKDFRDDITGVIEVWEENYLKTLDREINEQKTDFKAGYVLIKVLQEIKESQSYISSLKGNNVQKVIIDKLMVSYIDALEVLRAKYSPLFPDLFKDVKPSVTIGSDDNLLNYIEEGKIEKFIDFENQLMKRDKHLNVNRNWIGSKKALVQFFLYCREDKLIKSNVSYPKSNEFLKFLESRYQCDVGDQRKPSKFNKYKNFKGEYFFLN